MRVQLSSKSGLLQLADQTLDLAIFDLNQLLHLLDLQLQNLH
jgi:hypothetical protein